MVNSGIAVAHVQVFILMTSAYACHLVCVFAAYTD